MSAQATEKTSFKLMLIVSSSIPVRKLTPQTILFCRPIANLRSFIQTDALYIPHMSTSAAQGSSAGTRRVSGVGIGLTLPSPAEVFWCLHVLFYRHARAFTAVENSMLSLSSKVSNRRTSGTRVDSPRMISTCRFMFVRDADEATLVFHYPFIHSFFVH